MYTLLEYVLSIGIAIAFLGVIFGLFIVYVVVDEGAKALSETLHKLIHEPVHARWNVAWFNLTGLGHSLRSHRTGNPH